METISNFFFEYIFRPDSKPENGGGHISRCLSLSECLKHNDGTLFVLDEKFVAFKKKMEDKNFTTERLEDLEKKNITCNVCILDGYKIDEKEIQYWKKNSNFLVVIDDLPRMHPYADLLINLGMPDGLNSIKNRILSNFKYSIVNKDFIKITEDYIVKPRVENILLNFGLIDSKGLTLKILELLKNFERYLKKINVNIAVGSSCQKIEQIESITKSKKLNTKLFVDYNKMQNLILNSDIIIGAGGVGLIERVCVGVPSISILAAKNQSKQLIKLCRKKTTIKKELDTFESENFFNSILNLISNFEIRLSLSKKCKTVVDGNGSYRVSKVIEDLFVQI